MPVTSELPRLRPADVGSARSRQGVIPAVNRRFGDVDRNLLDASEFDTVNPPAVSAHSQEVQIIDGTPLDPTHRVDADDKGVGGYHHEARS